jgi:hypothetical protein
VTTQAVDRSALFWSSFIEGVAGPPDRRRYGAVVTSVVLLILLVAPPLGSLPPEIVALALTIVALEGVLYLVRQLRRGSGLVAALIGAAGLTAGGVVFCGALLLLAAVVPRVTPSAEIRMLVIAVGIPILAWIVIARLIRST